MDNGLQDVISAAANSAGRKPAKSAPNRRVPQLSVVGTDPSEAAASEPATDVSRETTFRSAPAAGQLGHIGLRLAFWVCGFHAALMERHQNGEQLTKKEELLLTLSPDDFVGIRPHVIDMTLSRLDAVVNAPDLPAKPKDFAAIHPMEAFALTTLRSLARRARRTLEEDGPDAALSMFGESAGVMEPLAIFRLVFSTALDLVESFERLIPGDTSLLSRLAEALDSEVDRI
ncbi:MAG TPA: hypothetical protein VFG12_11595 [Rhodopila sp.]|jgi:hypothetical protein|nr:hypothetical protein [Rhodopila sp.]